MGLAPTARAKTVLRSSRGSGLASASLLIRNHCIAKANSLETGPRESKQMPFQTAPSSSVCEKDADESADPTEGISASRSPRYSWKFACSIPINVY